MSGASDRIANAIDAAPNVTPLRSAKTDGSEGLPPNFPITPLGVNGSVLHWLDQIGQHRAEAAAKHSRLFWMSMFGPRLDVLYEHCPRRKQHPKTGAWETVGIDWGAVEEWLVAECVKRGVINVAEKIRGPGAWPGDCGELILHVGDLVLINGVEHAPGTIGRHVYPAGPPGPRPHPVACDGRAGKQTLELIRTWNWRRGEVDAIMMLGVIGAAMIGGGLSWRPHAAVTGGPGTGKSTFNAFLDALLGGASVRLTDATAAGVWQRLATSTLPVLFDEFEAEDDPRRTQRVIGVWRQASSGGMVLRGGADHHGAEFTVRSVFVISSILVPPLQRQDRSRIVIFELGALQRQAPPPLSRTKWADIGSRLARRLVDGWPRFATTLEAFRLGLARHGYNARAQDTFGTLLACADVLLHDGDPHPDHVEAWCDALQAADGGERGDDAPDEARCLAHLLTSTVDPFRTGARMQLADLVAKARMRPSVMHPDADPESGNRALAAFGLKVVEREGRQCLAVANNHTGLDALFSGTHWRGRSGTQPVWVQALRRLPGASQKSVDVRFGSVNLKSTLVPIEATGTEPLASTAATPGPLYATAENGDA